MVLEWEDCKSSPQYLHTLAPIKTRSLHAGHRRLRESDSVAGEKFVFSNTGIGGCAGIVGTEMNWEQSGHATTSPDDRPEKSTG